MAANPTENEASDTDQANTSFASSTLIQRLVSLKNLWVRNDQGGLSLKYNTNYDDQVVAMFKVIMLSFLS